MLIIYAHPNKIGNCGAILKEVENSLRGQDIKYELIDLYDMKYDPVMTKEEHYTSVRNPKVSLITKSLQEKISQTKEIIFIYPTWWNGVPGILKGFFEKIFTAKYAFKYKGMRPIGLLKGKKALVFTTTGVPRFFGWLMLRDQSLKGVTKNTLSFCGVKAKGHIIGSSRRDVDIAKIKKVVKKGLKFF